jgi:hypothetical protein
VKGKPELAILAVFTFVTLLHVPTDNLAMSQCQPYSSDSYIFSPLTRKDVKRLELEREIIFITVPISDCSDVNVIIHTGVVIMTQEPTYVVVIGDQKRIQALRDSGFELRVPVETDHRMRQIRVWIRDKKHLQLFFDIASDVWPPGKIPGYVEARAYDSEIRWLEKNSFSVQKP